MKVIPVSVRDFALPVPRRGSIEALSGLGRSTQEGQEIHARIQRHRALTEQDYESEVKVCQEFTRENYIFRVSGRMDGLYRTEPPCIEEIKSSFSLKELIKRLREDPEHPYGLQLRTYGYFYWLQNQVTPRLTFHLVSSRTYSSETLQINFDVIEYENWLSRRLDELVVETRRARKTVRRRKNVSLTFPFSPMRSGQSDLVETIEKGMALNRRLLLQAPTGLGKTVGVLFPVLKEALRRGNKVIYVTPKNSQHSVAEDAIRRFQEVNAKIKSLTLTAKSKLCFKNEPLCNPDYCEYARDHYTKVHENQLARQLSKKKRLTSQTFRKLGALYQVCPFELQLEAAACVDAVICDYNYVFAPRNAFGRLGGASPGQQGKPNLVIDEAHNLAARAMGYYSPTLSTQHLEKMRPAVREMPTSFRAEAEQLLNTCQQIVLDCAPFSKDKSTKIDPDPSPFLEHEAELKAFLSRYLDSDAEILPQDVCLRLCFYWSEFTSALQFVTTPRRPEFFTTFHPLNARNATVRITCCDASAMLRETYDEFEQVVAFSATLKPFDYYAKLSGLESQDLSTAEFPSPFQKSLRKLLIIPQISTKYSQREKNYPKIREVIRRLIMVKKGNYFAFFPSFEFLDRVYGAFEVPEGFTVFRQTREMKTKEIDSLLDHLRETDEPTIVFAVQGGVFSEGVDYPGKMIIGAFIVGPPLPNFDLEREEMRRYYEQNYKAGFDYAYTFPAMAKAVQAAGRVIRSEQDRGLIVLLDSRFLEKSYAQSMPTDWFETGPRELVSQAILKEVEDFWNGRELRILGVNV